MNKETTVFERIRANKSKLAVIAGAGGVALGLTGCAVEAPQPRLSDDEKFVAAFETFADATANLSDIVGIITIDNEAEAGNLAAEATTLAALTDVYQSNPEANDRTILITSIEHSKEQIQLGDSYALTKVTNPLNGEIRLAVQNAPSGYTESNFPIETGDTIPAPITH